MGSQEEANPFLKLSSNLRRQVRDGAGSRDLLPSSHTIMEVGMFSTLNYHQLPPTASEW